MFTGYKYEVWKGKKLLGHYWSIDIIRGESLIVPTLSPYKQPFNKMAEWHKYKIKSRVVLDNGVDITFRTIIDASRKSKRQIALLKLSVKP